MSYTICMLYILHVVCIHTCVLLYLWRQDLWLNSVLDDFASVSLTLPQEPCVCLSAHRELGLQAGCHASSFDMDSVNLSPGPYASEARVLSTEPTPQL